MLKRITLENFFSFGKETTIELNPDVNILVGINASGKSNFLKAIRLLYEGVYGIGLEKLLINEWGGLDNVVNACEGNNYFYIRYFFSSEEKEEIEYSIKIFNFNNTKYSIEEDIYIINEYNKKIKNYIFQSNDAVILIPDNTYPQYIDLISLEEDDMNNQRHTIINHKELVYPQMRFSAHMSYSLNSYIKNINLYGSFNTSKNAPLRQPAILGQGKRLVANGENLNSVIQHLQNNHSLEYEKIEERLKDINPHFKGISFNYFASKVYLSLREGNLTKTIPIESISDGTLAYLAFLSILYNPERGRLVCLDEPERGLHPDMINTIAKAIKYASKNTQLFIATHSPLLLNAFDLEDILIFEKDENNQTKVLKIAEEQKKIWSNVPTGQLWLNGKLGGKRFKTVLQNIENKVNKALDLEEYLDRNDKEKLQKLKDRIEHLLVEKKITIADGEIKNLNKEVQTHFTQLDIEYYKVLEGIEIRNLNKVNVIAGANNVGKTSLLETVYLATQLNDVSALVDLERYRGKFKEGISAKWLNKNVTKKYCSSKGVFNSNSFSITINKETNTAELQTNIDYLNSIQISAKAKEIVHEGILHLYEEEKPKFYSNQKTILCPAAFTSPYRHNTVLVAKAYDKAVTDKYLDEIILFIKNKMDNSINKIEMISSNRIMVSSSKFDKAIDITKYGEGLQRVFEIALLMGYCQNGVLCIDELDSAIHKNLLIAFTKFIQESAEKFNVQVFLSTHSKECIDAFVENEYKNEDITAYALTRKKETNQIVCKFLKGDKLARLIDSIDIDIR